MNMNKNNKHAAAGIDPQALASFANALASFANAFAILSVIRLCLMCLVCRTSMPQALASIVNAFARPHVIQVTCSRAFSV